VTLSIYFQVLSLSFRGDQRFRENGNVDRFKRSDKTCYKIPEGSSAIEGKILSGPRHVPGFTDVPNQGPETVGYVPATHVVLCFNTYSAMAKQAADSRVYGGIHIAPDNDDGLKLGNAIGQAVWARVSSLRRAVGEWLNGLQTYSIYSTKVSKLSCVRHRPCLYVFCLFVLCRCGLLYMGGLYDVV
jgi:hypothetical protein